MNEDDDLFWLLDSFQEWMEANGYYLCEKDSNGNLDETDCSIYEVWRLSQRTPVASIS